MARNFLIFTLLIIVSGRLFGQDISSEDYLIYSILIKKETSTTAKSICIIKYPAETLKTYKYEAPSSLYWEEVKRQDKSPVFLLQNHARDSMGSPQRVFDDTLKKFFDKYYEIAHSKFTLRNSFNLPYEVILLKKLPLKAKSVADVWKRFYEKYPGSGGIFAFSSIMYSENKRLAIFYHWVKRNGLNGHGELVVMCKTNDSWHIFYTINLWYN